MIYNIIIVCHFLYGYPCHTHDPRTLGIITHGYVNMGFGGYEYG